MHQYGTPNMPAYIELCVQHPFESQKNYFYDTGPMKTKLESWIQHA